MNEATEHNPDKLTPEIYGAPHWRLLRVGEVIEPQDQVFETGETGRKSGQWEYTVRPGMLPDRMTTYRRRVPTRQPEESEARREVRPSVCETCQGHGFIPFTRGQTPESFEQGEYACPDCNSEPTRADLLSLIEELSALLGEECEKWVDGKPIRQAIKSDLARAEAMKGDR